MRLMRTLCTLLFVFLFLPTSAQAVVVCAESEFDNVEGVDVSYWQGDIDWAAVREAGYQFAFIRVSDGVSVVDNKFDYNWQRADEVGMIRGAYQFFRPGSDPIAQAELMVRKISNGGPLDLPPVIDVETADGLPAAEVAARLKQWLDYVELATGRKPIIYTGKYIWEGLVKSYDFVNYPLWIAQYGPTCPNLPDPWTSWKFFQYTSNGEVPGISTKVDLNRFNGSRQALLAWLLEQPVCGDGSCNGVETPQNCAIDCPSCAKIPRDGRVVDESDRLCFYRGGEPSLWRSEAVGVDESLLWTYTTSEPAPINYGMWSLDFDASGRYLLEVHIPQPWGMSSSAKYVVRHAGAESTFALAQSSGEGWLPLGELSFAAGGDQWVRLDDNTGEPYVDRVMLVFDAIRIVPITVDPDADPEPDTIEILDDADMPDPDVIEDVQDEVESSDWVDPPPDIYDPDPIEYLEWPDVSWPDGDPYDPGYDSREDKFFDCSCRSSSRHTELPWFGLLGALGLASLLRRRG